jgi:hypothetical protein
MSRIFVNYRREDSSGHAGRMFDRLKKHFGRKTVFWDVSGSIQHGEQFDQAIERAVASCDVFLAVIGQKWLSSIDTAGKRRLEDPNDYVRLEIAKALERKVRVIPVLVERATMPNPQDLPQDLKALAKHQAIELTDNRWDYDISELINTLEKVLGRSGIPAWVKATAGMLLLVALGFGIWTFWPTPDLSPQKEKTDSSLVVPSTEIIPDVGDNPSSPDLVAVPDVRGLTLDVAKSRLAEANLSVGQVSFYTLGNEKPNTVYNQKTLPGSQVRPGTTIGLYVEREKLPGIESSGQIYLSPTEVWDLDGEKYAGKKEDFFDIRFDVESATERYLEPIDGAAIAVVGREPVDHKGCETATYSSSRIDPVIGSYVCVLTNQNRYSLLRIENIGKELKLSFDTWSSNSGTTSKQFEVSLGNRDSYHFRDNVRSTLVGGDFYLNIEENGAAQFFANNRDQRGLVDLGDIGDVPLHEVAIPKAGYYQYGVPVVASHTYVSLARTGEDGKFIVFKVEAVRGDSVIISYIYR